MPRPVKRALSFRTLPWMILRKIPHLLRRNCSYSPIYSINIQPLFSNLSSQGTERYHELNKNIFEFCFPWIEFWSGAAQKIVDRCIAHTTSSLRMLWFFDFGTEKCRTSPVNRLLPQRRKRKWKESTKRKTVPQSKSRRKWWMVTSNGRKKRHNPPIQQIQLQGWFAAQTITCRWVAPFWRTIRWQTRIWRHRCAGRNTRRYSRIWWVTRRASPSPNGLRNKSMSLYPSSALVPLN